MNLAFVGQDKVFVDFPVQTPTDVSYAIKRAETTEERLRLFSEYLKLTCGWDDENIATVVSMARFHLNDPRLKLIVI